MSITSVQETFKQIDATLTACCMVAGHEPGDLVSDSRAARYLCRRCRYEIDATKDRWFVVLRRQDDRRYVVHVAGSDGSACSVARMIEGMTGIQLEVVTVDGLRPILHAPFVESYQALEVDG